MVGRPCKEILAELDADLGRQQDELTRRRHRIAMLRKADRVGDLEVVIAELTRIAGVEHPALQRELKVAELLEVSVDPEAMPQMWQLYRDVLGDDELANAMLDLGRQFEGLRGLDPQHARVDEIASAAAGLGPAVAALMPDLPPDDGSGGSDRFVAAMETDLGPAQIRCLRIMTAHWKKQLG